jgi:hypothetical protein
MDTVSGEVPVRLQMDRVASEYAIVTIE